MSNVGNPKIILSFGDGLYQVYHPFVEFSGMSFLLVLPHYSDPYKKEFRLV